MQYTSLSGKKAWAFFFAIWLLSSLILGVVHGAGIGIFFGLGIASGYLAAARLPALLAQRHQRLQREADVPRQSASYRSM